MKTGFKKFIPAVLVLLCAGALARDYLSPCAVVMGPDGQTVYVAAAFLLSVHGKELRGNLPATSGGKPSGMLYLTKGHP